MKVYKSEKIIPDLPGIIMLSHGLMATGLADTVEMLFGEIENVTAISFENGDDLNAFRKEVEEALNELPDGTIIMTDLLGGTPYNQMLYLAKEQNKPLNLITGMNLPMFVTAFMERMESKGSDLIKVIEEQAKAGITHADMDRFLSEDDEDDE